MNITAIAAPDHAALNSITGAIGAAELVDELLLQFQNNLKPALGYAARRTDQEKGLTDVLRLVQLVRQRGWRAHFWM